MKASVLLGHTPPQYAGVVDYVHIAASRMRAASFDPAPPWIDQICFAIYIEELPRRVRQIRCSYHEKHKLLGVSVEVVVDSKMDDYDVVQLIRSGWPEVISKLCRYARKRGASANEVLQLSTKLVLP